MMIKLKRIYDDAAANDGFRVLVDRLWPRGVSREDAALNRWMKEIAPSDQLRRWFDHDSEKWEEFRRRYTQELEDKTEEIAFLSEKSANGTLTLVYAARDTEHNHAVVLKDVVDRSSSSTGDEARNS